MLVFLIYVIWIFKNQLQIVLSICFKHPQDSEKQEKNQQ